MNIFSQIWDTVISHPMVNALAFLYDVLWDNIGLSIISLTIIFRVLLIPLTLRQHNTMRRMQAISPQLQALRKKYSGKSPEERRKLSSETFRLYREAGVSPLGCLGPLVIQIPIWIGFYRAILLAIPVTPEGFASLSRALYSWNPASDNIPFNAVFLGVDMVANTSQAAAPWQFLLPVLVGATLWLQQRIATPQNSDPQQASSNRLLLWMMPIMFGAITWVFPAGLALYITVSNVIGFLLHYLLGGRQPLWGPNGILFRTGGGGAGDAQATPADTSMETGEDQRRQEDYGKYVGVHRQDGRRGNRHGSKRAAGRPKGRKR